jgi:hemolysin activation/secretion protein
MPILGRKGVQLLIQNIFLLKYFVITCGTFWFWISNTIANPNTSLKVIAAPNPLAQQVQTSPEPTILPPSDPNRDRFLQPTPTPSPAPEEGNPPVAPTTPESTPEQTQPFPQANQTVFVKDIEVKGSTILSPEEIDAFTQPFKGRSVTVEKLAGVADAITEVYVKRGYITSRAVLIDQTLESGLVQIRVLEGGIEEIRVEGTKRVNPAYIRSRIRLAKLNPLRKEALENQLLLLQTDPLFKSIQTSLRPGNKLAQSILVVRVVEANPFKAAFNIDNYSPPSVGSERFGIGLAYRNITGFGDEISAAYTRSTTGGSELLDFNYRIPVNAMNGTVQLRAAINNYKITDPEFENLNIRGDSDLYEISYRQPLIRTPRKEFALSFGFAYQDGQTFLFDDRPFRFGIGPDENGESRTSVFKFGQEYISRDPKGAWSLRSQFNFGTGLFDATSNSGSVPDGQFFSWLGQLQRVQLLNRNNLLIVGLDVQLTPNSLLPSQQFVIGGGQSVRGYRQNIRYGDNGVRFSVEDRITLIRDEAGSATLQIAPFFDLGAVWNKSDNPNNATTPDQRFLAGAGLGVIWEPIPRLNVRLDYGVPFVDLRDRGDNAQDEGFYFSVLYQP